MRWESAAAQIARTVGGRAGIRTVHVVAHGQPGEVSFTAGALTLETLPRHAGDLAAIGQTLGEDGELPLWSCETGAGARGVCRCGGGRRER